MPISVTRAQPTDAAQTGPYCPPHFHATDYSHAYIPAGTNGTTVTGLPDMRGTASLAASGGTNTITGATDPAVTITRVSGQTSGMLTPALSEGQSATGLFVANIGANSPQVLRMPGIVFGTDGTGKVTAWDGTAVATNLTLTGWTVLIITTTANSFTLWKGGVSVGTSTATVGASGTFGIATTGTGASSAFKSLRYWPRVLTNAEIAAESKAAAQFHSI